MLSWGERPGTAGLRKLKRLSASATQSGGTLMTAGSTPHEDEYLVQNDTLRRFIQDVTPLVRGAVSPAAAVARLRPAFSRLLNDRRWLPDRFRAPCESGGMGGGIGQWLLYRSADRSLTLFSLVV